MKRALLTSLARMNAKYIPLWRKLCSPSGIEYADMLKRHGTFHSMGDHCSIIPDTHLDMPHLISLGDNVRLASCTLMCHDGVVNMLERAYGDKFDAVGKIVIGNNVFIGHGAFVMRNVTIGDNVVVGARSLVNKNLPSGFVYAGVPAKPVCTIDELRDRLKRQSDSLPWQHLIKGRKGFDPTLEHTLNEMRVQYYFG